MAPTGEPPPPPPPPRRPRHRPLADCGDVQSVTDLHDHPGHMSRKNQNLERKQIRDVEQTKIFTHVTRVNGRDIAVQSVAKGLLMVGPYSFRDTALVRRHEGHTSEAGSDP